MVREPSSRRGSGRPCLFRVVRVDDETATLVGNGRVLPAWPGDGPWALVDGAERVLAVYEPFRERQAKPVVVMSTPIA